MGDIKYNIYDLCGNYVARRTWPEWYGSAGAIVYMVDVSDYSKLEESKEVL